MPERLAVEGEVLVTYRFRSGWIGLASPVEISAVNRLARGRSWWKAWMCHLQLCLHPSQPPVVRVSPGRHLRVNSVPGEIAQEFGVGSVEDVSFIRLSAPKCIYRDAIRFPNGRHVLLQRFKAGISFQVLTDGSGGRAENMDPNTPLKLPVPESGSYASLCGRIG